MSIATAEKLGFRLPAMFRALGSRNYRLFFVGQGLSLIGTWMTRIATSWLIYSLTHSALLLGTLGFAGQIPTFLLAPVAGVLVDRWDRYKIMIATQTLSMIQSFALAFLTLTHRITVTDVLLLSIAQGLINAFDTPARQSYMVRLVDRREDLSNAIALNSSLVNSARLIGPAIAGVIIAAVGTGWCFFADGVSFLAVIGSLLMMRVDQSQNRPIATDKARSILGEFREGWKYVGEFKTVRNVLLLLGLICLMGMPYTVLLPLFATRVLHGGAKTLGWLMSSVGVGAVIGSLVVAARKSVIGLGRVMATAAVIFGVGLTAFSLSHIFWVSMLLLMVTGFGFVTQLASSNTLIQTVVEDKMRGRVMSFYTMAFFGTTPFGSLLAGVCASKFGAAWTLCGGGALCVVGGAWFAATLPALRQELRPIYKRMGILPAAELEAVGLAPAPIQNSGAPV